MCFFSFVEEDFTYQGHKTHEILPSFRALTNEAERTLDLLTHGAARAKALVVNGVCCWVCSKRKRRGSVWPAT